MDGKLKRKWGRNVVWEELYEGEIGDGRDLLPKLGKKNR